MQDVLWLREKYNRPLCCLEALSDCLSHLDKSCQDACLLTGFSGRVNIAVLFDKIVASGGVGGSKRLPKWLIIS